MTKLYVKGKAAGGGGGYLGYKIKNINFTQKFHTKINIKSKYLNFTSSLGKTNPTRPPQIAGQATEALYEIFAPS